MLIMPLHGAAADLSLLLCSGDRQERVDGGQSLGLHQNHHEDEGSTAGSSVFHPCHNMGAAAPVVTMPGPVPDVSVRPFSPDNLYSLFVPEQPQRPPLI